MMKLRLFVPVTVIVPITSGAAPVFLIVTGFATETRPSWSGSNVSDVGVVWMPGTVPVPLRFARCGVPAASSATWIEAVASADDVGLNVTPTVQLPPAAIVVPQVVVLMWKRILLVPVSVTPERFITAAPVFLTVSVWAALVEPTGVEKASPVAGANVSAGTVPVPLRATSLPPSSAPE